MRKLGIAAVLVAAGVIAASGVFAQELKFDGYVNTGIGILSTDAKVLDGTGPDTKAADIKVVPFGVDSEQAGYRFRLNGSYASEDGNTGAKFRLQAQSKFTLGALSIPYAYGWASFFDKVLTVNGGLVDDGTWASGGFFNDDAGEGLGTLIKVSPIGGLNLGVGAYVISAKGGGDNNIIEIPAGEAQAPASDPVTDFTKIDIGLDRLKYTFNAGYTLPDLFKITLAFRTANQTGDKTSKYADSDSEVFASTETSKLIFGAQILAVKGLTAVVEAEADKLEDTGVDKEKDNIDVNIYEALDYKLGDLAFGLNAVQNIRVEKDVDKDFGLHINPWVSYALGVIVPRLDLNYYLAGTATTTPVTSGVTSMSTKYHRKVFAYKDNGDADDVSVFAARPSVKFNVGKGTIEIGDLIAYAMGPAGSFADAADTEKSSSFNNVFYVDFKWSF
ncbi:MAG: hypothetical protein LBF78_08470 [Treponema sp.]|jgi:hypothetical protein|nr:hypothetical protein [Treponema sp.]